MEKFYFKTHSFSFYIYFPTQYYQITIIPIQN